MQPIIIIGTQRSGSNLLRLMLNQHKDIIAPHPPHILQMFFPLLERYGDLGEKKNFLLLVRNVCEFVNLNPVPWNLQLDVSVIAAKCRSQSLISIYAAIYETLAARKNAQLWCCKSMVNLYYIPQIEQEGLKPIYIHLVRDGRDVAASFRKAIVGEKHSYYLAKQWKQDQDTAEKNCHQFAPERYVRVMYENIIHDTENTLRILLHHLGLVFEPAMLEYYATSEARETAGAGKMWNNVSNPVLEKNSNKFLSQLSEPDILLFESIAGETLEKHGYTPYFNRHNWKKQFTPEETKQFEIENEEMKKEALRNFDPEGMKKREGQDKLIARIKLRDQKNEN